MASDTKFYLRKKCKSLSDYALKQPCYWFKHAILKNGLILRHRIDRFRLILRDMLP
jgi:hypothetical protein